MLKRHNKGRSSGLIILLLGMVGFSYASPPDPIVDLTAVTGTTDGTIVLNWSAPSNIPVTRYFIRYLTGNTLITIESQYTAASPIEAPPVNNQPPTPASPGSPQNLTLTGLTAGTVYSFSIKSEAGAGNLSTLSNGATAQAKSPCGQNIDDGKGFASMMPSSLALGTLVTTTVTYIVNSAGIQTGGKIALQVPDSFPLISTIPANGPMGLLNVLSNNGGVIFGNSIVDGRKIILSLDSGSLGLGDFVKFVYGAQTCNSGLHRFRVFSQNQICGILTELSNAVSVATISTLSGSPAFLNFDPYQIVAQVGTATAFDVKVKDACNNDVTLASPKGITLSTYRFSGGNYIPDTAAALDLSASGSFSASVLPTTISSGTSKLRAYYKIPNSTTQPNYVLLTYDEFNSPFNPVNNVALVVPLSGGITDTSVDKGTLSTSQKTVTFDPGKNEKVYVNFKLPTELPWTVIFSTDGFVTAIKTLYGNGRNVRVAWDGYIDPTSGQPASIAAPATFSIRIQLGGLVDDSCSATLQTSGLKGSVIKAGPVNLEDVNIELFGPTNRYTRSLSNGTFKVFGINSGAYTVRFFKPGYIFKEVDVTVVSGATLNMDPVALIEAATLRLYGVRLTATNLPDTTGSARAYNADYSKQAYGTVRFRTGFLTSDAGDDYNSTPTGYTDLFLEPAIAYQVKIEVPGFAPFSLPTTTLAAGVTSSSFTLTKQPTIEGKVTLPSGGNTQGLFVSVEAAKDANGDKIPDSNDFSDRLYGGVYLPPNQTIGVYRVFGSSNGQYVLRTFSQNFTPSKINATVVGGSDVSNADFPTLLEGGSIAGTITVIGDSTLLDGSNNDGKFEVPINSYSPGTGQGSYAQIQLNENAATTSGAYQLKGLEDGTYQVFVYQPGFGLVPPGPKTVTVTSGVGALNLTLAQFTGRISGNLILPAGQTASIDVLSNDGNFPTAQVWVSSYSIDNLGTGFYTLRAQNNVTKLVVSLNVQVTNGIPTTRDIDLSGPTYSISGRVTSSARAPYTLSYILNSSTPTPVNTPSGPSTLNANRISATQLRGRNFNGDQGGGGATGGAGGSSGGSSPFHDPKETYVAYFNALGEYSITGLSEGSYEVETNGEINGDTSDGKEIGVSKAVVYSSANITGQDFNLTDGYTVSGTLRVASGVSESGRPLDVQLINNEGTTVVDTTVNLNGTSATFTLSHVPPGTYVLTARDTFPKKYASKDISLEVVAADITNKEIQLVNASVIKGKLQFKNTGVISSSNYSQYLPNGFRISARSNPHIPGGYGQAEYPLIDSDGYFKMAVNPGTYDIVLGMSGSISESDLANGKIHPVSVTKSAITVRENESKDIGFITLSEGVKVSGTIVDTAGTVLPNIRVKAEAAKKTSSREETNEAFTDANGKYVLHGIDPEDIRFYNITAAPYPDPFDTQLAIDPSAGKYAQVVKGPIDTSKTTTVNFTLEEANSGINGTILTSDGGQIRVPFGEDSSANLPGAIAILNRHPDIPKDNPLGDIQSAINAKRELRVRGLAAGVYDLYILAGGYGSFTKKDISINANQIVELGNLTLQAGYTLSGLITKSNGDSVNTSELKDILAVRNNFDDIAIGKLVGDSSGNILEYSISGMQSDKAYSILGFGKTDSVISMASAVTLTSNTELDLVFEEEAPGVLTRAIKNDDGTFTVVFKFGDTLRNSAVVDDNNPLSRTSGGGTLGETTISTDRTEAEVIYTPGASDTSFTIQVSATFISLNPDTGDNNTVTGAFTFFTGVAKQNTEKVTNASGGTVALPGTDDSSEVIFKSGCFGEGDEIEKDIGFSAADTLAGVAQAAGISSKLGALAVARKLGAKAYPLEMATAMAHLEKLSVSPFSSFYDIFLPAGVSHFFPEGSEARLCLTYDSTVTDPYSLNIYYYNSTTSEYTIESANKSVDTDNKKICVDIGHASVFTVLASSVPIISGDAYTGELAIINFPNPFNLKSKTVTLQNPGSVSASQVINGTLMKLSVPSTIAGSVEIKIFNVAGELLRTINSNVSGGAHYYLEWDGLNDHGQKVASGTYIARFTVGGSNEKFFKMVVLK